MTEQLPLEATSACQKNIEEYVTKNVILPSGNIDYVLLHNARTSRNALIAAGVEISKDEYGANSPSGSAAPATPATDKQKADFIIGKIKEGHAKSCAAPNR